MADRRNPPFSDGYWWSNDGLRLHYRDYEGRGDRPVILCMPGLTRNARDFDTLAQRLSGEWRVIVVELRGRGESAYARDPMTYVPMTYLQDIDALLAELKLERVVLVGTSLGGILAMLLGAAERGRIFGVVLNDIGPEIDPAGLNRIRGAVGKSAVYPTWMHAARAVGEALGDIYPDFAVEDWLAHAKRLYRLTSSGRITLDYDMKIAEPFRVPGNEAGPDMWGAFNSLAGVPTLSVRGELSDILAASIQARMIERIAGCEGVVVPNVGHAPTLDEPVAVAAIDRLLARVSAHTA